MYKFGGTNAESTELAARGPRRPVENVAKADTGTSVILMCMRQCE